MGFIGDYKILKKVLRFTGGEKFAVVTNHWQDRQHIGDKPLDWLLLI